MGRSPWADAVCEIRANVIPRLPDKKQTTKVPKIVWDRKSAPVPQNLKFHGWWVSRTASEVKNHKQPPRSIQLDCSFGFEILTLNSHFLSRIFLRTCILHFINYGIHISFL